MIILMTAHYVNTIIKCLTFSSVIIIERDEILHALCGAGGSHYTLDSLRDQPKTGLNN
jgi:hypothetical protein